MLWRAEGGAPQPSVPPPPPRRPTPPPPRRRSSSFPPSRTCRTRSGSPGRRGGSWSRTASPRASGRSPPPARARPPPRPRRCRPRPAPASRPRSSADGDGCSPPPPAGAAPTAPTPAPATWCRARGCRPAGEAPLRRRRGGDRGGGHWRPAQPGRGGLIAGCSSPGRSVPLRRLRRPAEAPPTLRRACAARRPCRPAPR